MNLFVTTITVAISAGALFMASACTDTTQAKFGSYGKEQTVCLFDANGKLINKWVSSGKVDSVGSLHVFNDKGVDEYVKVSGTAIVSHADYCQVP